MFDSLTDLSVKLSATGYFIDPVMVQVVFLAAKLKKPLLLEGPAGSGKTQLALSVAAAADTHVERLQCYRGVSEDKAIGRFDEGLQRLYMEFSKSQHENWQTVQASLKGRDFFRPGPLMRALECERPCVLLIDELDKVDDGFEAQAFKRAVPVLALGVISITSRKCGCHSTNIGSLSTFQRSPNGRSRSRIR
jgi:MoxR-like ATPase